MTLSGFGTEIWEWLVAAILVGVALLAALTAFVFEELRWPRRYSSTLFFACLFVIWAGASLVIVVMRNHL